MWTHSVDAALSLIHPRSVHYVVVPEAVRPETVDSRSWEERFSEAPAELLRPDCSRAMLGGPIVTIDGSHDRLVLTGLNCRRIGLFVEDRSDPAGPSALHDRDPSAWLSRAVPGAVLIAHQVDDDTVECVPLSRWIAD